MTPRLRAQYSRVFANLISMREGWKENSPSPETLDDFFYAISSGEITEEKLRLFLEPKTNQTQNCFLSPKDSVQINLHRLSRQMI